jgi:ABC-2 type transport system permease protein
MSLALWGFLSLYLKQLNLNLPAVVPVFLGALILWDVLFRAEIGVCVAFLEEVWSRNLVGIFVSPLSPFEFVISQVVVGVLRTSFATCIMILIAALAYHFNIFDMGFYLVGFFVNLIIMGWSIGLVVTGLIMRFGQGAESLAWAVIFFFQPLSAVFYPVSALPAWLQPISWATPAACVFEGMRALLIHGTFDLSLFLRAVILNAVYLAVGALFFMFMFHLARRDGQLLTIGE